jgi:formylglycine-generating enzyme required for sulfatase activity
VFVKGGAFQMGSSPKGDERFHDVSLSDFHIGKFEVTNRQFAEFLNAYGNDTVKAGAYRGKKLVMQDPWGVKKTNGVWAPASGKDDYPILNTTWEGANEFCEFYGWRLPTDAEWEFAAKGGMKSNGFVFSGNTAIDSVGWYDKNSGNLTHPVGLLRPNELGIFDMTGNVWEWCYDWWAPYDSTFQVNPTGPATGIKDHSYRGGCWLSNDIHCTNTYRVGRGTDYHGIWHNGFRCAWSG